jgi:hypothetical protein
MLRSCKTALNCCFASFFVGKNKIFVIKSSINPLNIPMGAIAKILTGFSGYDGIFFFLNVFNAINNEVIVLPVPTLCNNKIPQTSIQLVNRLIAPS